METRLASRSDDQCLTVVLHVKAINAPRNRNARKANMLLPQL
jgi:hypothetical protein